MTQEIIDRLSVRLDQWRESNDAVEFALTQICPVGAHPPGEYLTDKRDVGLIVRHPAAQAPDTTLADASRWLKAMEAKEPELLGSYHLMLQTEIGELEPQALQARQAHALEFANAWVRRVEANHGLTVKPESTTAAGLRFELVRSDEDPELAMGPDEVASVLQRLYGQKHPERALSVAFDGGGQPFLMSQYLRGFHEYKEGTPHCREADPEFCRAFAFAYRWCKSIEAFHNIYACDFQMSPNTVHVLRDDISPELYLYEREAAAAISARYHQRYENSPIRFYGEYCK